MAHPVAHPMLRLAKGVTWPLLRVTKELCIFEAREGPSVKKLGKEDLNIVSKCRREKKFFLSESSCVKTITSSIRSCHNFGVGCYLRVPIVDV